MKDLNKKLIALTASFALLGFLVLPLYTGALVSAAEKVLVCHKGKKTLSIGAPALRAHLAHGDVRGECDFDDRDDDDEDNDDGSDDNGDNVVIEISNPSIETSTTTATISFDTNVETKGTLMFGTDPGLASSTQVDLSLSTNHEVLLEDLESNTTYYFKIDLMNADGSSTLVSDTRTFTTLDLDTQAPGIMFLHTFNVETNSVSVIWMTTESSDAQVWISTESDVDTDGAPDAESTDLSLFHVFDIAGLEADTEYFIKVSSSDSEGNTAFSGTISFTTDA